jgi:ATP-dependent Clp protease ATP-binding subunit ClpA
MFEKFTDQARHVVVLAQEEARMLDQNYIGTEHILLGLIREGESEGKSKNPAAQILSGLGVDPARVRHQVIALIAESRGEEEAGVRRVTTGGGKRKLMSELRDRLDSVEWRLSALEQRVGTGPDVRDLDREIAQVRQDKEAAIDAQDFENAVVLRDRERQLLNDKAARVQEWKALPSLTDEVERLRDLLRRHGIDPQDGVA